MITTELLRSLNDERDTLRSEVVELLAMPVGNTRQMELLYNLLAAFVTVIDYFEAEAAARAERLRR